MDIRKYLVQLNVPVVLHEEALESFEQARIKAQPLFKYKLLAPFLIFWLLYCTKQVKWEDDKLPAKWWKYDNNISMNGDGWGMQLSDGSFINYVDKELEATGGAVAMPYTDPRYQGDCYYCKGSKPRSKLARLVWLGIRNKASAYAQSLGSDLDIKQTFTVWGEAKNSRTLPGMFIGTCDGKWQLRQHKKVLFGKFFFIRNLGHKINNAITENKPHAMIVWIPYSIKDEK